MSNFRYIEIPKFRYIEISDVFCLLPPPGIYPRVFDAGVERNLQSTGIKYRNRMYVRIEDLLVFLVMYISVSYCTCFSFRYPTLPGTGRCFTTWLSFDKMLDSPHHTTAVVPIPLYCRYAPANSTAVPALYIVYLV